MCEIKLKPCPFVEVKLALTCGNCKWYEPFAVSAATATASTGRISG